MPDHRDDIDPMDEAYLRAEQALDDEVAREARRARVLAAVAQEQPAAAPVRRPIRRYGGWLAAACVAGLSVWTAQQVYRANPPPAPAAVTSARPAVPAVQSQEAPQASPPPRVAALAPPAAARRQASAVNEPVQAEPPAPLPIPPVQSPIAAAPPPPAPAPPPPAPPRPIGSLSTTVPAPVAQAKANAADNSLQEVIVSGSTNAPAAAAPAAGQNVQTVVVTGSRIARRDYTASSPVVSLSQTPAAPLISGPLKALDGPSRLREAAAAGLTADIEALLMQGVPVDAADENGETALMKSIQVGQFDAVALLRRHGASLDRKNRAGVSARDMAAQKNDISLNEALNLFQ